MKSAADRHFDELYKEHFRPVLAYCLRRSPAQDGYDAANEVFAIAWRRIEDVPHGDAALPWLFVVARRVVFRRWRSARRFRNLAGRATLQSSADQPDPETIVVQRAEYDRVVKAAASLSGSDREILSLAAWEGLPHREIADILGCSIAAVDQRLHRAKQRLAKQYRAMDRPASLRRVAGGEGQ